LTKQNTAILARLRKGPALNTELAQIALKYTSRISELREYLERHTDETIVCIRCHRGLNKYKIAPQKPPVSTEPGAG